VIALIIHVALTGRTWVWDLLSPMPPVAFLVVPIAYLGAATYRKAGYAAICGVLALAVGWTQADINLAALRHRHVPDVEWEFPWAAYNGRSQTITYTYDSFGQRIELPPTMGPELPAYDPAYRFTSIRAFGPGRPQQGIVLLNWNSRFWDEGSQDDFYPAIPQGADVYHLQEYWDRRGRPLERDDELVRAFPGYAVVTRDELVTVTKFPVRTVSGGGDEKFLRVDVDTPQGLVSFYNVHISMQLGRDMPATFQARGEQFAALRRDLEANTNPVVISGDFNSTTSMGTMRWLLKTYRDTIEASDAVIPATWAYHRLPKLRMWRLDYVFASRELSVVSHENVAVSGSDHHAQRVEIQL
jgi:hypothetical protein